MHLNETGPGRRKNRSLVLQKAERSWVEANIDLTQKHRMAEPRGKDWEDISPVCILQVSMFLQLALYLSLPELRSQIDDPSRSFLIASNSQSPYDIST